MKKYFYTLLLFFTSSLFIYSTQQINNTNLYKNISTEINSIINKHKLNNTRYSIAIYSANMNRFIYTYQPQTLLVPASNTKLITTFTTYNLLKNDNTIKTKIAIDGEIINGTLNGNLYIIGEGDALLSVNDLEIIADEIKMLGIYKINGNIIGDDTFFDNIYNRFHYSGDKDEVEPTPPVSALSLDRNVVNVIVTSGSNVGKPVNVSFKPASSGFVISNSAVVHKAELNRTEQKQIKKTGSNIIYETNNFIQMAGDMTIPITLTANTKKKKSTNPITISSNLDSTGRQIFYIKGALTPNRTFSYRLHIRNPALAVACALYDRLISGGIIINGNAMKKTDKTYIDTNNNIKIIYTFYRNVNEIINIINKKSDNFLAENLFKLNGALFYKDKNTAKSAVIANIQILNNYEINTDGFIFNDGSGLSRRNLITSEGLVNMIIKATQSFFADDFINSLSIAGYDGTLLKRMVGTFAAENLKGKTGTHRDVSSLSGIMKNRSNDTLYFAFIFNGGSIGIYKNIENEICVLLSEK